MKAEAGLQIQGQPGLYSETLSHRKARRKEKEDGGGERGQQEKEIINTT